MLDDQLSPDVVRDPLARWATTRFVRELQPDQIVKDERIPSILRGLRAPTFVTIDDRFRHQRYRDRRYCILYFALRADEQGEIPALLRRLLRLPAFRTRAARMGKVARVSRDHVSWWELGDENRHSVHWSEPSQPRVRR